MKPVGKRRSIAVFVPGGVGSEQSGKYIPALVNLLDGLSRTFDVTVYSLTGVGDLQAAVDGRHFRVRTCGGNPDDSVKKRTIRLVMLFLKDHMRARYHLLHGIWAVPPGLLAVLLGKVLGVPSMVSVRGGEAACLPEIGYGSMRLPRLRKVTLWTCRQAGTLTCLSRFQWDCLQKFGMDREEVHIIPTGADCRQFSPSEKHPVEPIRFLHVANLNEVKDQATLLSAFAIVRRQRMCRLRLVGPDFLDGKIQALTRELGIEDAVEFTGYVPNRDLSGHYRWAHMLLHTSRFEGQGMVVAEAAAAGVPVVGSTVGLISDLGEARAGLAPPGDAGALAREVTALLEQPDRYASIRAGALAWAREHDLHWTINRFRELYYRALSDR